MSKFKVGDKVQILCNDDSQFDIGTIGIIKSNDGSGHREWKVDFNGTSEWFDGDEIELTTPKLTKNQRITALEKEVAELKVIVHQLRKPSTVVQEAIDKAEWQRGEVENIIEFEGKQYKKVEREAREGDVVIIKKLSHNYSAYIKTQKPYLVLPYVMIADKDSDGHKGTFNVYAPEYGRTPETVDVYELIVEETAYPPFVIPEPVPVKSPNELRAEIIEKAKRFVEKYLTNSVYGHGVVANNMTPTTINLGPVRVEFVVNEKKRTIVALTYFYHTKGITDYKGIAKCMPGDVFNEHIGKAIALGRALGVDVSEFEQAVQPTIAVGQITNHGEVYAVKPTHRTRGYDTGHKFLKADEGYTVIDSSGYEEWLPIEWAEILNDTNAQYEVGEQ